MSWHTLFTVDTTRKKLSALRKDQIEYAYKDEVRQASLIVKAGGLILYPSDSLWGIGCDASNREAVETIDRVKNRPKNKSYIVLVSDDRMLQKVVREVPEVVWDIIDNSSSPVSIIYEQANPAYGHLCAENGSIAVRLVQPGFCREFISYTGIPLISSSANQSGKPSPLSFEDIDQDIIDKMNFIFPPESGLDMSEKASKVISIKSNGQVAILR
ncbi:MAG: Sua5/YciO/YrdC/YwlC family protein [Vicingaceae bacterium]